MDGSHAYWETRFMTQHFCRSGANLPSEWNERSQVLPILHSAVENPVPRMTVSSGKTGGIIWSGSPMPGVKGTIRTVEKRTSS